MKKFIRKAKFLLLFSLIVMLFASFDGGIPAGNAALQKLVVKNWAEYGYPQGSGGFSIMVIAPEGEYFASSLPEVTRFSHFRIASVTKMTTAAAFMLLEQRGLVKLDDPITAFLPGTSMPYLPDTAEWSIPYKEQITPRLLLQHYAGVFDLVNDPVPDNSNFPFTGKSYFDWILDSDPNRTISPSEQASILSKYKLSAAKPGTVYHYSNTGYTFLTEIIARASGKTVDSFISEELLSPLGLVDTSFPSEGTDQEPPWSFITGLNKKANVYQNMSSRNVSPGLGAYNAVSTLHDVAWFIRTFLDGNSAVSPETVMKMHDFRPSDLQGVGYGLGLMNAPPDLGFGLNGNMKGYQMIARSDPIKDVTVVILSSLTDADSPSKILPILRRTALEAKKLLGY